jgi:predicted ester cyclase
LTLLANLLTGTEAGAYYHTKHRRKKMSMSLEELKTKYRWAKEEAVINGNLDALDEVYDPDVAIHRPPFTDIKGLEAYKQYYLAAGEAYSNIQLEWEEMIGEGNTLACRYTARVKHTGVWSTLPVPPTVKDLVIKACLFIHLKDGKIIEEFWYDDYLGLHQQLGIVPPMGKK